MEITQSLICFVALMVLPPATAKATSYQNMVIAFEDCGKLRRFKEFAKVPLFVLSFENSLWRIRIEFKV